MPRTASTIDEQDLERALLRKSVDALADEARPLRGLRAHAADRRDALPLRRGRDRLRAVPAAAPRRAARAASACATASTATPFASTA